MSTPSAAEPRKTLLNEWHRQQGANMAVFGGYEMPLWYPSGARTEHLTVIRAAGVFDTSHMSVVMVQGGGALELLQRCFSKNLECCIGKESRPLTNGRSVYGVFLNPQGEVIDDAIVFQLDPEDYMVVVNAGMGPQIAAHIREHADSAEVAVTDLSDRVGKLDVQGPESARILAAAIRDPDSAFDSMPYFSFKGNFDPAAEGAGRVQMLDGTPILLSRTGYTGEFGFEIFTPPDQFTSVWRAVLTAGEKRGLTACGLAARDSLRAGAVLPLSHQDIGPWPFVNNPWQFALPYDAEGRRFTKDFIGADALRKIRDAPHTLPFAGFDLRKVATEDSRVLETPDSESIGAVLTCVTDMAIGRIDGRICSITGADTPADFRPRGLCCGFVRVADALPPGRTVRLGDRRREIEVEIVTDIRPDRTARKPLKNFL